MKWSLPSESNISLSRVTEVELRARVGARRRLVGSSRPPSPESWRAPPRARGAPRQDHHRRDSPMADQAANPVRRMARAPGPAAARRGIAVVEGGTGHGRRRARHEGCYDIPRMASDATQAGPGARAAGAGALDVGTVVADTYEVTGLIGRGGMGAVWAARHLRLPGKRVALKVLLTGGRPSDKSAISTRAFAARPRSRRASATRTSSRSWTSTRCRTGTPYLVLEFLEGEDLRRAPRARADAARRRRWTIARQIGSASARGPSRGRGAPRSQAREHVPVSDGSGRGRARSREGARLRHLEDPRLADGARRRRRC